MGLGVGGLDWFRDCNLRPSLRGYTTLLKRSFYGSLKGSFKGSCRGPLGVPLRFLFGPGFRASRLFP